MSLSDIFLLGLCREMQPLSWEEYSAETCVCGVFVCVCVCVVCVCVCVCVYVYACMCVCSGLPKWSRPRTRAGLS